MRKRWIAVIAIVVAAITLGVSAFRANAARSVSTPSQSPRPAVAPSRVEDAAPAETPVTQPARPESASVPPVIPAEHAIAPDANPNVAAVVASARAGTHPERRSALLIPAPFSEADFARDPDAYLAITEPGRVWQTREPGVGVPAIEPVGSAMLDVPELGTVGLRVRAVPHAPVNFYSADKGAFSNHLTSITVRADAEGIAETAFTATKGTTNTVTLLAACPLASGQVQFLVEVVPPSGG